MCHFICARMWTTCIHLHIAFFCYSWIDIILNLLTIGNCVLSKKKTKYRRIFLLLFTTGQKWFFLAKTSFEYLIKWKLFFCGTLLPWFSFFWNIRRKFNYKFHQKTNPIKMAIIAIIKSPCLWDEKWHMMTFPMYVVCMFTIVKYCVCPLVFKLRSI